MKVLVCGSRHFNDYKLLEETLDGIINISEIIHGAARGADTLGAEYAFERDIPVRAFPANWTKYGRRAGPIRNSQMLSEGKPDLVVAFMGPNSRGTKHMVSIAQKAGVETIIIDLASRVAANTDKLTSEA